MSRAELDAAGITDPALRTAYARCRALNARHGRTYFLATRALPPRRRPAVHALYGFARWVDDIVDNPDSGATPHGIAGTLHRVEGELAAALDGDRTTHPILAALGHTARHHGIDPDHFAAFMRSMREDLTVTTYATYADLRYYMYGSAAVIGLALLPILGTVTPREEAAPHAAALGEAFQLTNFLRDVGEDLARGRIYLPLEVLEAHGVDSGLLRWCGEHRRTDPRVRGAMAEMVALTRSEYRRAWPGIAMLDPVSRPCVSMAFTLYQAILDEIVRADYDVWTRRRAVPRRRRLRVALPAFGRTAVARLHTS